MATPAGAAQTDRTQAYQDQIDASRPAAKEASHDVADASLAGSGSIINLVTAAAAPGIAQSTAPVVDVSIKQATPHVHDSVDSSVDKAAGVAKNNLGKKKSEPAVGEGKKWQAHPDGDKKGKCIIC